MEWIKENYKWIFDGIGVFVISTIIYSFFSKKGNSLSIKQKQKSGDNSKNSQIGQIK